MTFVRVKNVDDCVDLLASTINQALKNNNKVVWLIPGGSNIPLSIAALKLLDQQLTNRLFVTLTDERFGNYGHSDSNWQQLEDGGFNFKNLSTLAFLDKENNTLSHQEKQLNVDLAEFTKDAYLIGQFGIGTDGHTAGIKPNSPATLTEQLVCGYKAKDFIRLTTTFSLIKKIDEAHVFALGSSKVAIMQKLKHKDIPLPEMPAQIFKQVKKSIIYNEEEIL